MLYYSIKAYFYDVTPYNLSDKDFAVDCNFYLSCISSSNSKVFFNNSFSAISLSLFKSFLFFLKSFRCLVYLLHFSFYSLFAFLACYSWSLRLFYNCSADLLWFAKLSYYLSNWAAYLLNFWHVADVLSYNILALEIFAANYPRTFLSSIKVNKFNIT